MSVSPKLSWLLKWLAQPNPNNINGITVVNSSNASSPLRSKPSISKKRRVAATGVPRRRESSSSSIRWVNDWVSFCGNSAMSRISRGRSGTQGSVGPW
ncbi:unannotated protein [freshwater metagenome]|uniref:Unannotated protein n=1 Tax=freshwater metagenome TaxID=449393 RepID=A0A6J6AC63_9ZZZZ